MRERIDRVAFGLACAYLVGTFTDAVAVWLGTP